MHYGDKEQLAENLLEVIVYNHEVLGTGETYFQITSVVSCKYVRPNLLCKIINDADKIFNNLNEFVELPRDKFYLVSIKQIDFTEFTVVSVKDVSENGSFCTLH